MTQFKKTTEFIENAEIALNVKVTNANIFLIETKYRRENLTA